MSPGSSSHLQPSCQRLLDGTKGIMVGFQRVKRPWSMVMVQPQRVSWFESAMWISSPDLGGHLLAYELYEVPCSSGWVGVREHGDSQDEATGADNARRDLRIAQVISADLGDMDLPTFQQ